MTKPLYDELVFEGKANPSKRSPPSDGGPSKTSRSCSKKQKEAKLRRPQNSLETEDGPGLEAVIGVGGLDLGRRAQLVGEDLGHEAVIGSGTDVLVQGVVIVEARRTEKVRRNFPGQTSTKIETSVTASTIVATPIPASASVVGRLRIGGRRNERSRRNRGRSLSLNHLRRRPPRMRNPKLRNLFRQLRLSR